LRIESWMLYSVYIIQKPFYDLIMHDLFVWSMTIKRKIIRLLFFRLKIFTQLVNIIYCAQSFFHSNNSDRREKHTSLTVVTEVASTNTVETSWSQTMMPIQYSSPKPVRVIKVPCRFDNRPLEIHVSFLRYIINKIRSIIFFSSPPTHRK
jgi:hypothetical protein